MQEYIIRADIPICELSESVENSFMKSFLDLGSDPHGRMSNRGDLSRSERWQNAY